MESVNIEKGSRDLLIGSIANSINNISKHTRQIYELHCLCNILVVKTPKINIFNPSTFRKMCFVTPLTIEAMSRVVFVEPHL